MKKAIPRLSWMLIFSLVGFFGFGLFIRDVLPWSFQDTDAVFFFKLILTAFVGLLCLLGLPVLALVLGTHGVLPGTRR